MGSLKRALSDLLWRAMKPSLAESWDDGWAAGFADRTGPAGFTSNPYRDGRGKNE